MQPLDLDDEEKLALLNLLTEAIEAAHFPLSPRVQVLQRILAKFGPIGPQPPPVREPDRREPPRAGRYRRRR